MSGRPHRQRAERRPDGGRKRSRTEQRPQHGGQEYGAHYFVEARLQITMITRVSAFMNELSSCGERYFAADSRFSTRPSRALKSFNWRTSSSAIEMAVWMRATAGPLPF